jgi:hypothetical protein
MKSRTRKFAVCLDNTGYPVALEKYKIYRVLPDSQAAQDKFLRIIDESGEDYLYPATMFAFVELPAKVRRAFIEAS